MNESLGIVLPLQRSLYVYDASSFIYSLNDRLIDRLIDSLIDSLISFRSSAFRFIDYLLDSP